MNYVGVKSSVPWSERHWRLVLAVEVGFVVAGSEMQAALAYSTQRLLVNSPLMPAAPEVKHRRSQSYRVRDWRKRPAIPAEQFELVPLEAFAKLSADYRMLLE